MENFDWTQFTLKIAIKAKLNSIYDAFTIPNELEKWFLIDAEFTDENLRKLDKTQRAMKGDRYQWVWYLYDDIEKGIVTQANGNDYLELTFAGECRVDIRLTPQFEYTLVELRQRNIPTDDASKKNIRLGCHHGWSFYLVNLKSVYEGGIDLRNKDNRFKPMINN